MAIEYNSAEMNLSKILKIYSGDSEKLKLILIDNISMKGNIDSVGVDYLTFVSEQEGRQIIPFKSVLRIIRI